MARVALLVGATGLVGGHVLASLVGDERWSRVVVLARRALDAVDAKVAARIVDFESLVNESALDSEGALDVGRIDDVFACLGTTIKVAGSQERFRRVDHEYTVAVARLGKKAGATRIALVSSVGADAEASSFYMRVKGETERDVRDVGYATTIIARPSILVGARSESRPVERAGIAVTSVLSPLMLGGLRAYRPIKASDVAAAMVEALARACSDEGARVLLNADLMDLAKRAKAAKPG